MSSKLFAKRRDEFYSHVRPEIRALAERKERITKAELPERMNSYERRVIEPNLANDILMEQAEYCMGQAGRELGKFECPRHYNDAVERLYAPLLVKRLREAEAEIARLRAEMDECPECEWREVSRMTHKRGEEAFSLQGGQRLNMSILEIMIALSEGNPGALRVLSDLLGEDGMGFLDVLGCDSKRLYGPRIWMLYKDVCGEDIQRFRYHLQVELPNQETGELNVTGPHAPRFGVDDSAFWSARKFGKPGSFWALQKPPGRGYRFPLAMDGSEPSIEVVDAADWSSETPREEGIYSLKIAPERQNGAIFAGGNDGAELVVEIVYPAGIGLPLGKGSDGSPFHLGENKLIGAKWRKIPKESATAPEHSPPVPPP